MVASLPSLNLSLAPQWLRLFRAAQWIMALLIAGALSLAAWSWWHSRTLEADAAQYEVAAERVEEMNRHFVKEAARAGVDLADERLKALPREVAFTNQLLEQRAFSWTRFLNDLEEAVPPSVSIGSITVNFKDSLIALNGTARSLKDLTGLVNGLEGHAAFRNVVLSQHTFRETEGPRDGSGMLEFTLT
ncbi:MAG: PilN domain-containing protein, partial [Nitrospiraceae bacterium]